MSSARVGATRPPIRIWAPPKTSRLERRGTKCSPPPTWSWEVSRFQSTWLLERLSFAGSTRRPLALATSVAAISGAVTSLSQHLAVSGTHLRSPNTWWLPSFTSREDFTKPRWTNKAAGSTGCLIVRRCWQTRQFVSWGPVASVERSGVSAPPWGCGSSALGAR